MREDFLELLDREESKNEVKMMSPIVPKNDPIKELKINIRPTKTRTWEVKIITKTEYESKTYISDTEKFRLNIFANQGLPGYDDGKYAHSGYNHPFYKEMANKLEDAILNGQCKAKECWAGVIKEAGNNFEAINYGAVAIFLADETPYIWMKINNTEIIEQLKLGDGELTFRTTSKKILDESPKL